MWNEYWLTRPDQFDSVSDPGSVVLKCLHCNTNIYLPDFPWHFHRLFRSRRVCLSSTVGWKWSMAICVQRTSSSTRVEHGRSWALTSASPPQTPQMLRYVEKFCSVSSACQASTPAYCLQEALLDWYPVVLSHLYSLILSHPFQPKYTCKEWEPNLPPLCLPNPEYLAPEYILSVSCDSASDMYSLGVVMHAIFNEGKPVFQVNKHDIFKSFSRQLDQVSGSVLKRDKGLERLRIIKLSYHCNPNAESWNMWNYFFSTHAYSFLFSIPSSWQLFLCAQIWVTVQLIVQADVQSRFDLWNGYMFEIILMTVTWQTPGPAAPR